MKVYIRNKNQSCIAELRSISVDPNDDKNLMFPTVDGSSNADGAVIGAVMYQWQRCLASTTDCSMNGWSDLSGAITTSYGIDPNGLPEGDRYRVKVTYTDGQGYSEELYSAEYIHTLGIKIRTKIFLESVLD